MIDLTEKTRSELKKTLESIEAGEIETAKKRLKKVIKAMSDEYMVQESEHIVLNRREFESLRSSIEQIGSDMQTEKYK